MRSASSRQRLPPATTTALLKAGDARAEFARDDRGPVTRQARKPAIETALLQLFWRTALTADLPCGVSAGGPAGSRRSSAPRPTQKIPICRMFSTGATGLEPATSGVTGLFYRYHDWRRLPCYRSSMRVCGSRTLIFTRSHRLDFARLLPFCCPNVSQPRRTTSPISVMVRRCAFRRESRPASPWSGLRSLRVGGLEFGREWPFRRSARSCEPKAHGTWARRSGEVRCLRSRASGPRR